MQSAEYHQLLELYNVYVDTLNDIKAQQKQPEVSSMDKVDNNIIHVFSINKTNLFRSFSNSSVSPGSRDRR